MRQQVVWRMTKDSNVQDTLSELQNHYGYSGPWTLWKSRSSIYFGIKKQHGNNTHSILCPWLWLQGTKRKPSLNVKRCPWSLSWLPVPCVTANLVLLSLQHHGTNWVLPSSPAAFFHTYSTHNKVNSINAATHLEECALPASTALEQLQHLINYHDVSKVR